MTTEELATDEIDQSFQRLEDVCAAGDAEDDERLTQALAAAKQEAKSRARRQFEIS